VFDSKAPLGELYGKLNIIYTGSFFHLFSYERQLAVAELVVKLLASVPGSTLIGRQVGNLTPGSFTVGGPNGEVVSPFRHNEESWKAFWDEVGEKTGTKWDVKVEMYEHMFGFGDAEQKLSDQGIRRMAFVVTRL
jgi:hypothetical protein